MSLPIDEAVPHVDSSELLTIGTDVMRGSGLRPASPAARKRTEAMAAATTIVSMHLASPIKARIGT